MAGAVGVADVVAAAGTGDVADVVAAAGTSDAADVVAAAGTGDAAGAVILQRLLLLQVVAWQVLLVLVLQLS